VLFWNRGRAYHGQLASSFWLHFIVFCRDYVDF